MAIESSLVDHHEAIVMLMFYIVGGLFPTVGIMLSLKRAEAFVRLLSSTLCVLLSRYTLATVFVVITVVHDHSADFYR